MADGVTSEGRRSSDTAEAGAGGGAPSGGTPQPTEPKAPKTPEGDASLSAAPVSPALSGRTPAGWAGTWRGSTSNDEELIIVNLRAGKEGQAVGTIEWPVAPCKGELTLVAVIGEKLVIHEVITEDPKGTCRAEAKIDFNLKGATLFLGGSEWGKEATLRRA
ncbi:hypothetical protein OHA37_38880 [Streptomyces sp. NBC_00335]|uniref:hypothetical protein n=1 Tax=unclassified Streptomyces TaxID=2593676 RepID=UPI00225420C3|nr:MULTISPECIES: hypothetical protein [unclassified Streptomyces]MCX5409800.1 hypothetical protein [Streptomyces sp. NBC_00086]